MVCSADEPKPDTISSSSCKIKMEEVTSSTTATVQGVTAMQQLDLLTCTAEDLAQYLRQHRFQDSESLTASFLQEAQVSLPSQPNGTQPSNQDLSPPVVMEGAPSPSFSLGKALTTTMELSIVVPRAGKFQVTLHRHGLLGTKTNNPSTKLQIPHGSVTHMIFFPKPEDCKKATLTSKTSKKPPLPPGHMVLLCVDPPISILGAGTSSSKAVSQICLQLPWDKTVGAVGPVRSSSGGGVVEGEDDADKDGGSSSTTTTTSSGEKDSMEDATNAWKRFLLQSLGPQTVVARVGIPGDSSSSSGYQFSSFCDPRSSSTTSGMPFVKCYQGVNDGVLYPLPEGLLFFKPPNFIPRSSMHSISCGRGSSGSSSRYVDMMLTLHRDKKENKGSDSSRGNPRPTVEFSNIQREELGVLNGYIQTVLIPAMQQDAVAADAATNDGSEDGNVANDSSSDASSEETENEVSDNHGGKHKGDNDDDETDEEDSDNEDDNFEIEDDDDDDDDGGGDSEDSEDDGDEDDDFEVVADDFAKELARNKKKKKSGDASATESEEEDEPVAKRRRRRTT